MYLMDCLASAAAKTPPVMQAVAQTSEAKTVLGIYRDMTNRMRHAPRFLLDASATQTMVELSLGRPKVLREAMMFCRVPYQRIWVEWEETYREKIRQTFHTWVDEPGRPIPERLGFLVECEEGGRRGVVTWAWTSPKLAGFDIDLNIPNVAPISAFFDLDNQYEQSVERSEQFLRGNLPKLWKGNPTQIEALLEIWKTAVHRPSEWGRKYLGVFADNPAQLQNRIDHCFADVYGEYIGIWAVMMILTSSRKAVDYREVNRAKINKARAKRREVPLLDHTEVVMHISGRDNDTRQRAPIGHARKSPRIHMVSRYLARRGNRHWIVEPYMRGSGDGVERHVHVRR